MLLIALTGGIAAGKSSVAKEFKNLGAHIIDADQLARDVVQPGEQTLANIIEAFGPEIVLPSGQLDRPRLGSIIFADEEARKKLNAIIHPAIFAESQKQLAEAKRLGYPVTVYEIPLLVESNNKHTFDRIVTVETTASQQHERLVQLRGMSEEEATNRLASQASSDQRIKIADHVIDSSQSFEETLRQVQTLWHDTIMPLAQASDTNEIR